MPTTRRRARWIEQAIRLYRAQTWPSAYRELCVVSEDALESILPDDVRFIRLDRKYSVGTKRNVACENATGSIIAHWDDDDWSSPERLEEQVAALDGYDVTGYRTMLFHDLVGNCIWYWASKAMDVCGTSLMYRRAYWENHRFPDKQIAEDVDFNKRCRRVNPVWNQGRMVARFHADSVTNGTPKWAGMCPGKWADLPEEYRKCEMQQSASA